MLLSFLILLLTAFTAALIALIWVLVAAWRLDHDH
jgi:hypothetical protein